MDCRCECLGNGEWRNVNGFTIDNLSFLLRRFEWQRVNDK